MKNFGFWNRKNTVFALLSFEEGGTTVSDLRIKLRYPNELHFRLLPDP